MQENRNYLDIAVPENGDRKGEKKKVEWNWKNEGRKKSAPKMSDSDSEIRLRGCPWHL